MNTLLEKIKEYTSVHMPKNSGQFADMFKVIMPSFSKVSEFVAKKAGEEEKKEIEIVLSNFVDSLLKKLIIPNTDQFLQRYDMSLTSPETYITYMITTLSYFHGLVCHIKKEENQGKETKNRVDYKFIVQSGCFGGSSDVNKPIDKYKLSEIVQSIMCMAAKWQNLVLRDHWLSIEESNERCRQLTAYLMKLLHRSMEIHVTPDSTGEIIDYEPFRQIVNKHYQCNVHMRRYTFCCLCRMLFICHFFSNESKFCKYVSNDIDIERETEHQKSVRINRIRHLLLDEAIGLMDMNGYVDKMRQEITNACLRMGAVEDFTSKRNMQELIPASIVNISFLPDAQMHMVNVEDEALREYLVESRSMYDERQIDYLWYAVPRLHQLYMDNIYLQALESLFTKNNQSFPFRGECHLYENSFFRHCQLLTSMDTDFPIIFNMFDRMYILFKGKIFYTTSIFDAIFIWCNIVERCCSAIVLNIVMRETVSMVQRGLISRQELSFNINYASSKSKSTKNKNNHDDNDENFDYGDDDDDDEDEDEEQTDKVYNQQIDFLKKCIWGKDYDTLKTIKIKERNKIK